MSTLPDTTPAPSSPPVVSPSSSGVERALLQQLFDHAPFMMGIVELHGDRIFHISDNQATARYFGQAPEAMRGRYARVLGVSEEVEHTWIGRYRAAKRTGAAVQFEFRSQNEEGEHCFNTTVYYLGVSPSGHDQFAYSTEDVTARMRSMAEQRRTATQLGALIKRLQAGILVEDEYRRIVLANQAFCDIFDIPAPPDALIGADCEAMANESKAVFAEPDDTVRRINAILHARETVLHEAVHLADGRVLERDFIPIALDGDYLGHLWQYRDVTEREAAARALEQSEAKYRLLAEHASDIVALHAADGSYEWVSPSVHALLGYRPDELLGRSPYELLHPHDGARIQHESHARLLDGSKQDTTTRYRIRHKDGHYVWLETLSEVICDDSGQVVRIRSSSRDVTDRQAMEARLYHQAHHDALTGLPNRILFREQLGAALEAVRRAASAEDLHLEAGREITRFAVLYLDLDRFKTVNDSLGHTAGDRLLVEVAGRMRKCLRPTDTVARIGGDEFAILVRPLEHDHTAEQIAARIKAALEAPVQVAGRALYATFSIGVVPVRPEHEHPEDMLREADLAMYEAKAAGKNCHVVFSRDRQDEQSQRLRLEMDLRHAAERDELYVLYQPVVGLRSGMLTGFEALVRWNHPDLGQLSPGLFIPLAEESGQVAALDRWVLAEGCQQLAAWQQQFGEDLLLVLNVNCSSRDLLDTQFAMHVTETLRRRNLSSQHLMLEITEGLLVENIEVVAAELDKLRDRGIRFSIDDFGTGYSSLSTLHTLPVDTLKIDRSFVSQLHEHEKNRKIVQTILHLARILGKSVVAEGIETHEQAGVLHRMDCPYGQGYLFSRPVDAEAATALIAAHKPLWKPRGNP